MKKLVRYIGDPSTTFARRLAFLMKLKSQSKILATIYSWRIYQKHSCCVSPQCNVHASVNFPHPVGIVIGDGVTVEGNCTIYQNVTLGRKHSHSASYPYLGSSTTVYSGAVVVGRSFLGPNSIVGANSVVVDWRGLPSQLIVGSPARPVNRNTLQKEK